MKIILTFTYKGSLLKWKKTGILTRELALYNEISKKDVNYSFLTYDKKKDLSSLKIGNQYEVIPIQEYTYSKFFPLSFLKTLLLPLKKKKIFREHDLIKTNQIYGSWIAFIPKLLYKKKMIVRAGYEWLNLNILVWRGKGIKNYLKYLFIYINIYFLESIAYRLADGIILTNEYDLEFVIKAFKLKKKYAQKKIIIISNFVDTNLFKPLNCEKKNKSLLFIGRLTKIKNIINVIEALKDINDFELDIIGQGPEKENLIKKAKELSVKLNFLGTIPNENLPEIINQYQLFILPSFSEGNPKTLLEAMSCGIPCIGTNVKGINNILNHKKNGYLCNTSPNSIKEAIMELYHNKGLRKIISENARNYILKNCSLSSIANKEYAFYRQIHK